MSFKHLNNMDTLSKEVMSMVSCASVRKVVSLEHQNGPFGYNNEWFQISMVWVLEGLIIIIFYINTSYSCS